LFFSCHKKTRATKKYSIRKSPNVLVVHLKRFDFSVNGKLSHHVAYPELLNLKNLSQTPTTCSLPTLAPNDSDKKSTKPSVYKLYGVLVHLGHTSRSGHYYSYVKGPNEAWFRADDSHVSKVQASEALSQRAYMLFYKRVMPEINTEEHLSKLNGHSSEILNLKPNFDINAKSPLKVNGTETKGLQNRIKNQIPDDDGERLDRVREAQKPVGNNILNNMLTSSTNGVKVTKTNGYSYSKPTEVKSENGFHEKEIELDNKVREAKEKWTKMHENGLENGYIKGNESGNRLENGHTNENRPENGHANAKKLENGHTNGNRLEDGHENEIENGVVKKLTKKQKIRRLTEKILQLKQSKKKPIKLKKLIRRRKSLRKLIKAKSRQSKENKTIPDLSEINKMKLATKPEFTQVTASLAEPLKIEKAKSFADSESNGNVLKALKQAAATSTLLTWDEQESNLLVKENKKKDKNLEMNRQRYDDDLDGIEVDSDEYNEEFDKPVSFYMIFFLNTFLKFSIYFSKYVRKSQSFCWKRGVMKMVFTNILMIWEVERSLSDLTLTGSLRKKDLIKRPMAEIVTGLVVVVETVGEALEETAVES